MSAQFQQTVTLRYGGLRCCRRRSGRLWQRLMAPPGLRPCQQCQARTRPQRMGLTWRQSCPRRQQWPAASRGRSGPAAAAVRVRRPDQQAGMLCSSSSWSTNGCACRMRGQAALSAASSERASTRQQQVRVAAICTIAGAPRFAVYFVPLDKPSGSVSLCISLHTGSPRPPRLPLCRESISDCYQRGADA